MSENVVKVSMTSLAPIVEERINTGKTVEITVTGESMYPLFHGGRDKVTLAPIKKLKRKMICFYKRDDGSYILHRIIRIKKNEIFCVGDNQTFIEGPLRKDQFIARVTEFERKGKKSSVSALWCKIYSFVWCIKVSFRPKLFHILLKLKGRK